MSIEYTLFCDLCMRTITTTHNAENMKRIIELPEIAERRIVYSGDAATLSRGKVIDRCTKCFEENRMEKK
jgi:hypothetical protein